MYNPVKENPMFGITRMDYERHNPAWWVRLAYQKNGKPLVQFQVHDDKYKGDSQKSLKAAQKLRNQWVKKLLKENGSCFRGKHEHGHSFKPKNNKSGLAGVRLSYQKSGDTRYFTWQVSWSEQGKPHSTSFGFSTCGGEFKAFKAAVLHRYKMEKKWYKNVNIDPKKVKEYYEQAKYQREAILKRFQDQK